MRICGKAFNSTWPGSGSLIMPRLLKSTSVPYSSGRAWGGGIFQRNNEKMAGNLSLQTPKLINTARHGLLDGATQTYVNVAQRGPSVPSDQLIDLLQRPSSSLVLSCSFMSGILLFSGVLLLLLFFARYDHEARIWLHSVTVPGSITPPRAENGS